MANSAARSRLKETRLSRRQIEGLIAEGHQIIIYDQKVLKVDAWLPYHPGGQKCILHMVGRDATDEINCLHSTEAIKRMLSYQVGKIEGRWKHLLPPIQGGKYRLYNEYEENDEEEDEVEVNPPGDEATSSDISRTPSPVFDINPSTIRQRTITTEQSPSISSNSSVVDLEEDGGMSFLDARTQEQLDFDLANYPSLDEATQDEIVRKYRTLYTRLQEAGLFECNYWDYGRESCRYALFAVLWVYFLQKEWYCTSAFFLGILWHQLSFVVHDASHLGITHNFVTDTLIAATISDYIGGLSTGWWKATHNVHHIVTNLPEHDPDNQHMPFFAVSHRFLESLWSTYHDRSMPFDAAAQFLVPYQAYLYYPILLFGRFNLYVQSWIFLIKGQGPRKGSAAWIRWYEIVGQVFFYIWFGYFLVYKTIPTGWDRFAFVMISHMTTMPLHLQITLSHFAMSTADVGPAESFPQKMLRTTMDVDCPQWLDFVHGGLQFQAIHHLYPRMPRHNLRKAQKMVQEFCVEVGIPYALFGFIDGNKKVIGSLGEVARQAAMLAKCQKTIAERGDLLHEH